MGLVFSGWIFRPRLVPTLFAVVGFLFLCSLGNWQLRRREAALERRAEFLARIADPPFSADAPPPDPDGRRASVVGLPDWSRVMLVAGKYMWMQAGYRVILPVHVSGAAPDLGWVLVDVGWIPADEAELILSNEQNQSGERTYTGLVRTFEEKPDAAGLFEKEQGYQRRWKDYSPLTMGSAVGKTVPNWILTDGEGVAAGADIPDRVPPVSGWVAEPELLPHGQYAFTWFSLAFTLLAVWGSYSMQRKAV